MEVRFANRTEAGRVLAERLEQYANRFDAKVLALPRGGVPVGYEVALHLNVPLEIFLVRKLGVPGHEEFAMGAIASGGLWFVNEDVVKQLHISRQTIKEIVEREERELERRQQVYGAEFQALEIKDRTIIVVDDGLATGSTMRVAIRALRQEHPARLIIGVPVASPSTCDDLEREVDELICVERPEYFRAVGEWYEDFSQTTDDEVRELLQRAHDKIKPAMMPPLWPAGF